MTLPGSLVPTLDALLTSGARWLPLGQSQYQKRAGACFLRAAQQATFDLVVVQDGEPSLSWTGGAAVFYEEDPSLFAPALQQGRLEPISLATHCLERATFVDDHFPELFADLERGAIDAQCDDREDRAVLRADDGTWWTVGQRDHEVVFAQSIQPAPLVYRLRRQLWKGTRPRTRPVEAALRARVQQALSADAIMSASKVEVYLQSPTGWDTYRLSGGEAFRYGDLGDNSPFSEQVYSFIEFPRAEVEQLLRASSSRVLTVEYGI